MVASERRGAHKGCESRHARPFSCAVSAALRCRLRSGAALKVPAQRKAPALFGKPYSPTSLLVSDATMLMTMLARNALPNPEMTSPAPKIPFAIHAARYSMSVFTMR